MGKLYSGATDKTFKNLLLDSGAWFKNYDMETDTFDTAVSGNKLIGATKNGGKFEAKARIRTIEVDGVNGPTKGDSIVEGWDVSLGANVLEFTKDTIKLALGAAKIDASTNQKYDIITAKSSIEDADYLENVTWVGTISGSNDPVIIQIFNAINLDGMSIDVKPKSEGVLAMVFKAHYTTQDLQTPPFKIHYPRQQ